MKHVTILETFLGGKFFFLSWRLAQNMLKIWVPRPVEAVTHRERRTTLLVQSTRALEVVQHAFAPQGGGRIEDAMRRVTAAPRSWRVGSIESRPDLGSRSFSILSQVADSRLFLKQ